MVSLQAQGFTFMNEQSSVLAALTVVVGGLLHGSFALPMKRMAQWKWENIWLVYSVVGLVVFPLLLALATVPALGQAIGDTPASTLLLIVVCGMGWGIGSTNQPRRPPPSPQPRRSMWRPPPRPT